MNPSPPTPRSPLLTDEELDALIEAFNRRESTPSPGAATRVWRLAGLLCLVGLGWWWA
jgi:hypothetical protein